MARQPRKQSGTGIYHVMLRGINRQDIFEDDGDYLQFIASMQGLIDRFDDDGNRLPPLCSMFAYCLMSNHVHLLMREKEESVSQTIKRLGVTYAHYYNRKYDRNGHLFQDRFRSEPVNDMAYFVTLMRYIHQNPVKACIVDNVDDYPWSSWSEYVQPQIATSPICSVQTVLRRFSLEELTKLISSPPPDDPGILDIDSEEPLGVSDDELCRLLSEHFGITTPIALQQCEKSVRNDVLSALLSYGGSIRQLSRMTGVSYGIIQRINRKKK